MGPARFQASDPLASGQQNDLDACESPGGWSSDSWSSGLDGTRNSHFQWAPRWWWWWSEATF